MGLLDKFLEKIKPVLTGNYYGYQARSSPFNGEAWDQDIFRATVDCIATHGAKGMVKHVVLDQDGRISKVLHNSPYSRLLNIRANPVMSGFEFKYRFFSQLETQTTAIAYIKWDGTKPVMICPVDYRIFEFHEVKGGGYAIEFQDYEGVTRQLLLEDCIIARKFYNSRQASGDGNGPIYKVLNMSKASDEGFIECLNISNKVRGLHKHKKAMLDRDDVEKSQEEFAARFEKAAKEGGIVSIDSMEEYTPISPNTYSANASQMREISNRIYTFLRTPEEVVQSKYTEQTGLAWYESKIEPIWELFSEALTNACFTEKEIGFGNRLMVTGGVLMGTSYQTRVNIIAQTKEIAILSINEQRELLGYPPIEGGDKRQVSLNYINADKQDEYQTGGEEEDDQEGQTGTTV